METNQKAELLGKLSRAFELRRAYFIRLENIQNLIIDLGNDIKLHHPDVSVAEAFNFNEKAHKYNLVNQWRKAFKLRKKLTDQITLFTQTSVEISILLGKHYPGLTFFEMMEKIKNSKSSSLYKHCKDVI